MKLKVLKITLENFKGVKNRVIKFDGNTKVMGANGYGKTTLADAYYWLFADVNTALTKNPPITPLNEKECESRVEIECMVDDKPLTVQKSQKTKTKERDGKITTTTENTYQINGVEKIYKNFISDLKERGIDLEQFLIFAHPNGLLNDTSKQGREKIRTLLFKMCNEIDDIEIANEDKRTQLLAPLLGNYKVDEIEQTNKATIKRINETMGKDNVIVNARIDELLSQKSKQNVKDLEEQRIKYEAEISDIEEQLEKLSGGDLNTMAKLSEARMKVEQLKADYNAKQFDKQTKRDKEVRELSSKLDTMNEEARGLRIKLENYKAKILDHERAIEIKRVEYSTEQEQVLDEKKLSCPVCNTRFSKSKAESIKADFERKKAENLRTIKRLAEAYKADIESLHNTTKDVEEALKECESESKDIEKKIADIQNKPIAQKPIEDSKEYKKLISEVEKYEADLHKTDDNLKEELNTKKAVIRQNLQQIVSEIAVCGRNKDIDKRVADLREERKKAEINRAEAEKILSAVEILKQNKNERLSAEINKHFEVAQFRLFKLMKNGNYEETCDVLIDGKEINSQANQSLQILARLDIIKGISDFFGIWFPVFVDDFSLITSKTEKRIDMNNQLVKLIAKDGAEELVIEKG